jgi:hypothetical protein
MLFFLSALNCRLNRFDVNCCCVGSGDGIVFIIELRKKNLIELQIDCVCVRENERESKRRAFQLVAIGDTAALESTFI